MKCYDLVKSQIKNLFLNKKEFPTKEVLEAKIPIFEMVSDCILTDAEKAVLIKTIITENQISIPIGTEVVKKGWKPWIHTLKERDNYYADRYKHYLLNEEGYPTSVVNNIFDKNEKILDYLENPSRHGQWIKKGLVMGYVQSGKTANYISLINKAADVGYKLIILIAGVHNNLREQTQKRVNEGFIGFDNLNRNFIGVGDGNNRRTPGCLTSEMSDFKRDNLRQLGIDPKNYTEPIILVIKKNPSTLNNIINWLQGTTTDSKLSSYPLLIIDDEADNASVNTKKDPNEATKINKQIREILNMFHKRCYVGYTATPFANIFIDPDGDNTDTLGEDLFPEDFIIALEAPSNYVGAKSIFVDKSPDILKEIEEEQCLPIKHPKDFIVENLPASLYEAVYLFLLSSAIKRLRGIKNKHNSMLINVSFRISIQQQIKIILSKHVTEILSMIKFHSGKSLTQMLNNDIMNEIYVLWEEEYKLESDIFSFHDILSEITNYESLTKVLVVNSKADEPLRYMDYEDSGFNVIAIGGYSLSRGYTLEGLTISYFLRNTKMYDTLLQMGRWFGYRDGYSDLCRVYMTEEAIEWYGYIAEVVEELKEELKIMEYYKRSPKDYGLKIKDHPASLIITARNKMYSAKDALVEVCYSNKLIETRVLSNQEKVITHNLGILKSTITSLGIPTVDNPNNFLWENVKADKVLAFVNSFKNHILNQTTDTNALSSYIEKGKKEELNSWDVALINIRSNEPYKINEQLKIGKIERTAPEDPEQEAIIISGSKHRVGQPTDERIGLGEGAIEKAINLAKDLKRKKLEEEEHSNSDIEESIKHINPIGNHYREFRTKPLLILYVIKVKGSDKYKNVVAYGMSFPKINNSDLCNKNRKGIYKVNTTWWNNYMKDDLQELEEELDD